MKLQKEISELLKVNQFAHEVMLGLLSNPRYLPSKYFYDKKGDLLFQQITQLSEYYLTRSELEILSKYKQEILSVLLDGDPEFEMVEFGPGDGQKTKILIEYFQKKKIGFNYIPIDISPNALETLKNSFSVLFPRLNISCFCDEYFAGLEKLNQFSDKKKFILFLGANIGNFQDEEALVFTKSLYNSLRKNDLVMIGFDLKKDPEIILNAYNDKKGITKAFNLNLLHRINNELGADFDLEGFDHYPNYCPKTGDTKSFLISKRSQNIFIKELGLSFFFEPYEPLQTELSKKYSISSVKELAERTGFEVVSYFFDNQGYFLDTIWKKV